jgi:hypothetical protein
MAKEMEPRGDARLVQPMDHEVDQAEVLAHLLAQYATPAGPTAGPDWASQLMPPYIPGTVQEKYAKGTLPLRLLGIFLTWVTWDWKRGAAVGLFIILIVTLIVTR